MPGYTSFSFLLSLVVKARVFLAAHDPLLVVKTFLSIFLFTLPPLLYGFFGSDLVPLISFRIYFFLLSTHATFTMPTHLVNGCVGVVGVSNKPFICLDVGRLRWQEMNVDKNSGTKRTPVVATKRFLPVRRYQVLSCLLKMKNYICTPRCCLLPPLQVNLQDWGRLTDQGREGMVFTHHPAPCAKPLCNVTLSYGEKSLFKYAKKGYVVGETTIHITSVKKYVGENPWLWLAAEEHRHEKLKLTNIRHNEPE